jgi:glycosyltransferase involved in cell wall biosynthesis
MGYKNSNELVNYYNAADLFIMSSKSEAGPVVSMEAMACNLPILSSNTGRVAELLKEENIGCIVDKNKIYRMQIYLEEFLSGKNKISFINREDAMKYFDWENVSKKFIGIYNNLLN